jgi:activating signal cointegrator 1
MSSETISVLSIRQPHADNIIFGNKWCENRTWQTRYRGPIFIHASRWDGPSDQPTPGGGAIGAIIGRADLVDAVALDAPGSSLSSLKSVAKKHGLSTKAASMEHVCGPVCFLLTNPKALVCPIPCGGKLNIWKTEVDPALLTFGQPQITTPHAASKTKKEPTTIGVGSRVNYKRANFYVIEMDEEQIGVAKRRNGPVEDWFDESDLELGWFG